MVSRATAVFPVWRSPIINSLCPRPIGTMESIHLIPVCIGSLTEARGMIPGALTWTLWRLTFWRGPYTKYEGKRWAWAHIECNCKPQHGRVCTFPSIGFPKASTTRPKRPAPTGTSTMEPVLFTISPSLIKRSLPKTTIPTLSASKFKAWPYREQRYNYGQYVLQKWKCMKEGGRASTAGNAVVLVVERARGEHRKKVSNASTTGLAARPSSRA